MIIEPEKIATVIGAFHDGQINFEKAENGNHIWKIDCEYLAKLIDLNYDSFWLKIVNCKKIQFKPWRIPKELPKEIWESPQEIFKTELEIVLTKNEEGQITLFCNQNNPDYNYIGGELVFECDSIEIFDQEWNKILYHHLGELVSQYWNDLTLK